MKADATSKLAVSAEVPRPGLLRGLAAIAGTRAFQQAALFSASVLLAGGLIMWLLQGRVHDIVSRQVIETMAVEAEGIAGIAETAGAPAAIDAITRRTRVGGRLYLLESASGTKLAGNLERWPSDIPKRQHGGALTGGTFAYAPGIGSAERRLAAGVSRPLSGQMQLLVGRDLDQQRTLSDELRWLYLAGFGALAGLGLLSGYFMSRGALGRIGQITATSDQIMTGDFSRRVGITGSGDELDRLASNLNTMLDRIESLMAGLREVSDNIAHDLKTPLTRLRTRAEAALRDNDTANARDGLGQVIEDADELIKTFNALLLIARLEAGAVEASAETFDLAALVRDVAELYEPVAEEAGLALFCRAEGTAQLRANRQLVSQAAANMIDNAIKYGRPSRRPAGQDADIVVMLAATADEVRITVADHGPGIPAVDRDRVLKRFVRLEASRTRPGTGLGLSLVAAVARLHGGHLLLEDNAPGLRIVLTLPGEKRSA